jgi:hypothetical protein
MHYKKIILAVLLASSSVATLMATPYAAAQMRGDVDIRIDAPPPPPRHEGPPPPPRHGYVWAPGYWAWDGHRHIWVEGHWERVRHGYHHYAPPGWQQGPDGWRFDHGGWQR